jgi:cardiolipin synthase
LHKGAYDRQGSPAPGGLAQDASANEACTTDEHSVQGGSPDEAEGAKKAALFEGEASNKVFTLANLISLLRLCLVPFFFVLLNDGHDLWATVLFIIAACTDWIDGQVARRTGTVSKVGQVLDPTIDRILMIAGAVGLLMLGRLPLWVMVFIVLRDGMMLIGGAYLLKRHRLRVPVVFAGKLTTAALLLGFTGLLIGWPLIPGLSLTDLSWLPGLGASPASWGMWVIYVGLLLSFVTGLYYLFAARKRLRALKAQNKGSAA